MYVHMSMIIVCTLSAVVDVAHRCDVSDPVAR